ncbi:MAG: hypothetical protein HC843_08460 [Sphingomonadales bacterium]|nr:hypothetical protein [Sphingomonadales bacterium]
MMAVEVKTLGGWLQTRNVLVENLGMNMEFQGNADFSDDPQSDFQKTQAIIDKIFADLQSHAVNGLKLVDENVKDSDLVAQIMEASAEAKKEADRIKNAVKTIEALAGAFDKVSKVVTKIAGLPFL